MGSADILGPQRRRSNREELQTALLLSLDELVWCTSADGRNLHFVNPAAEKIYGRPLADLKQNQSLWREAIHPDDRQHVEALLDELPERRKVEHEYRIVRPDGEVRWLHDRLSIVYGDDGMPLCVTGIGTDITDRRRAEEALARERDLLRTLIDILPDLIFVKDAEGRFITANAAILRMLGADELDQVIGKTDFDFSPDDLARHYQADDQKIIRSGKPLINREETIVDQDGNEIWLLTTKVPLHDDDGKVTGLVGISRNITKRKQAVEQMLEAKEAADAANRAKSDFLANMSHEIRTPMNGIIGMTELLLDTRLTPEQRDYLGLVRDSGDQLLMIINDILDFSKIEAGKLELDRAVFDLRESLGDIMRSLGLRAHGKNLELAYHIQHNVPHYLEGDIGRLRQILVNLVGNAIKFTEQGEVVVEVSCESVTDDHAQLHFSVSDTGIGISPEKHETIFEQFEQADTSTTRSYGGTGLGLAISSKLVNIMGGKIWLESQLDRGSTFHFTAKLALSKEGLAEAGKAPLITVEGKKVLVVDDNATNRRILQDLVGIWGMQAEVAVGAREALDLLKQARREDQPFQIVLTDVNMPLDDGFSLAGWMREDIDLADTIIIVLTSGGRTGDDARCQQLNIAARLMKPVKQSELFNTIVWALGVNGTADELSAESADELQPIGPLQILLAEDNLVNQKLAVGLLEKHGHQVVVAANGKQALDAWESQPFDLVLMDVQMPEMDGLETTRIIRQREQTSGNHIPIVAMTAHAMKGDQERCLAAGMDEYLAKPIRAKLLIEKLATLMRPPAEASTEPGSAPAAPGEQAFDWSAALDNVNGDADLLKEVVRALLMDLPRLRTEMHQAIQTGDAALLKRAAHSLKGSMLFLGNTGLSSEASRLELFGKESNLNDATEVWNALEKQIEQLIPELVDYSRPDRSQ